MDYGAQCSKYCVFHYAKPVVLYEGHKAMLAERSTWVLRYCGGRRLVQIVTNGMPVSQDVRLVEDRRVIRVL